jgi:hypothetical protein
VHDAIEVALSSDAGGAPNGWVSRYRITGAARPAGMDSIAELRAFLVAYGDARPRLDSLITAAAGSAVTFRSALRPDRGPIAQLVGGWPRLVDDGRNVGARSDSLEGTFAAFADRRHARSGIGFSRDSATLYLVTVDGLAEARRAAVDTVGAPSVGMSIAEFADQMIALGAWNAMAFDGGGSSTLFAADRVLNTTSDRAGEREVGISLFVVRRAR